MYYIDIEYCSSKGGFLLSILYEYYGHEIRASETSQASASIRFKV